MVKVCGLTCVEDALAAAECGADALGFIFAESPRRVSPDRARRICRSLPSGVLRVGVFADADPEEVATVRALCGLDIVQLHGSEGPEYVRRLGGRVIRALTDGCGNEPARLPADVILLSDAPKGGGAPGGSREDRWMRAAALARKRRLLLAGGLDEWNVAEAVKTVRPYGVDVCSGVETSPGRKDHARTRRFVEAAKRALEGPA